MQKLPREIFNSTNWSFELHTMCKPICKPSEKLQLKQAVIIWVKHKIYNQIRDKKRSFEWWIRWWLKILWHLNAVRVQVPLRVLFRTLITYFRVVGVFVYRFLSTNCRILSTELLKHRKSELFLHKHYIKIYDLGECPSLSITKSRPDFPTSPVYF